MKKLSPIIAIVVFIFHISVVSLAAAGEAITQDSQEKTGNTTVGYDAAVTYTVTIPANVTFTDTEKFVERPLLVSNVVLNEGSTLNVNIASLNDFKMVYGKGADDGYIEYNILVNYNEAPKKNTYTILTVLAGEKSGWAVLDFITDLNKEHAYYTGNYTDTLTFTITID